MHEGRQFNEICVTCVGCRPTDVEEVLITYGRLVYGTASTTKSVFDLPHLNVNCFNTSLILIFTIRFDQFKLISKRKLFQYEFKIRAAQGGSIILHSISLFFDEE